VDSGGFGLHLFASKVKVSLTFPLT